MVRKDIIDLINELKTYEPEKLIELGIRAYENAVDLVDEALSLVGQHSYARGFFLSFTAFEELGKSYYLCLLSHQLLGGVSKDDLADWYINTAKLFRFHPEKIKAAGLTRLIIDFLERESLSIGSDKEYLKKDISELDKSDIPVLVSYTQSLIEPMIAWFNEQVILTSEAENGSRATMDLRNRSLYVDIPTELDGRQINAPEDLPRDFILFFLATTIKYIDSMESYFELMRGFIEEDETIKELLISQAKTLYGK